MKEVLKDCLFSYFSYSQFSMTNGGSSDNNLSDGAKAAMLLDIKSRDILELTVTKTCLDVFRKLGAVRNKTVSPSKKQILQFELPNQQFCSSSRTF